MAKAKKAAKPRGRRNKGALLVISMMLIGSGLLRLGGEASQAIAKETDPVSQATAEEDAQCEPPADIAVVLAAIQDREARAEMREKQIAERMQAMRIASREIEERMAALKAAEEELSATIALAETASEGDLAQLTAVYENMKPKDAAALFETMTPDFAAGFLARMRPDAAAGIMTGLSPDSAYSISVVLAGRNAEVPKE